MAVYDRRLIAYIAGAAAGLVLMVIAALGEFVFHWWNDLGLWLGLAGLALAVALGLVAASRFQVRELGGATREVAAGVARLEASSARIEVNTAAIPRIEANTEAIPRVEHHTAEAVLLLQEIRNRLPPPAR